MLPHLEKLPLTLATFYPHWQPNSDLILPPLEKLPSHSCNILRPLAAQLLHHFTPSQQITTSPLHHFTLFGSSTLSSFYPPLDKLSPHSYTILPPWQPDSCNILPPLNKLPPHSYNILSPLAAQLLNHFTPSEQITPSLLQHFTSLGSPTLTSFYPLWTNYPPHSYHILPPLAAQLLHH